ncbi:MAG: 30S ribosomal protein S1 [Proteobacteria bacterium]|nr:30S ribosomal protein S1 [Pseudomonadota bacterium]
MGEENFADLLEAYEKNIDTHLKKGDKIKGAIIAISDETVFVDTGSKIDGAVDKFELLDEDGNLPYHVGDELDLYIVSLNESELILSRALSGDGGLEMVNDAWNSRIPVNGKVVEAIKGGFAVEIFKRRAFCPISQIDIRYVDTPADYVGNTFEFIITRVESQGKNIVVSRRELLERQVKEGRAEFLKKVEGGAVFDGEVRKLMDFGAFVELYPGVDGLVHISEISWSRIEKPGEVLKEGDRVKVRVIRIDKDPKTGADRMSLSIKQAEGNPWEDMSKKFSVGDTITGKAVRCTKFGVFVELSPGIEGLVHISEMSYVKRVVNPSDVVNPGDMIHVVIKDIDISKKRISLSMKDAAGDPWAGAENTYSKGKVFKGTIERKEPFGYFISVAPGITGLLPKSKINQFHDPSSVEKLKQGDALTVVVESISADERKLSFDLTDETDRAEWKTFSEDSKSQQVGSLGEKLNEAFRNSER